MHTRQKYSEQIQNWTDSQTLNTTFDTGHTTHSNKTNQNFLSILLSRYTLVQYVPVESFKGLQTEAVADE